MLLQHCVVFLFSDVHPEEIVINAIVTSGSSSNSSLSARLGFSVFSYLFVSELRITLYGLGARWRRATMVRCRSLRSLFSRFDCSALRACASAKLVTKFGRLASGPVSFFQFI
jgi:hypothetical protein